MRTLVLATAILTTLGACGGSVPDSGAGIGGDDFARFEVERAQREAALAGVSGPMPSPGIGMPVGQAAATPPGGIPSSDLAAAGIGASGGGFTAPAAVTAQPIGAAPAAYAAPAYGAPAAAAPVYTAQAPATGPDLNRTSGVQASPSNAAPALSSHSGISDEQSFEAVSEERTIAGDAALIAQNRANYQVVQPTALPERTGEAGPNIVQYALSAPNRRGQEWYSRFSLSGQGRFERNCSSYRSPDEAQRDFLARGGPDRDPRGIDPDGDGFACGWDPAPFRAAVGRG